MATATMTTTTPITIMCVDDHPLVRKGIALIVGNEPDMRLVAEASNGRQAVEMFRQFRPDVTLMDLRMPGLDGIGAVKLILEEFPDARAIALTSFDGDQEIYRALEAGVKGYLLKEMVHTDVLTAIRQVHAGMRLMPQEVAQRLQQYFVHGVLTPREVEVLELVAKGYANKEIAAQLNKAAGTVKIHVQNILTKLNATDRTHAVSIAVQRGIIRL
jgi:DNA-binding NarL/FixJ family response regulator